jgi:hypothetical protein
MLGSVVLQPVSRPEHKRVERAVNRRAEACQQEEESEGIVGSWVQEVGVDGGVGRRQ